MTQCPNCTWPLREQGAGLKCDNCGNRFGPTPPESAEVCEKCKGIGRYMPMGSMQLERKCDACKGTGKKPTLTEFEIAADAICIHADSQVKALDAGVDACNECDIIGKDACSEHSPGICSVCGAPRIEPTPHACSAIHPPGKSLEEVFYDKFNGFPPKYPNAIKDSLQAVVDYATSLLIFDMSMVEANLMMAKREIALLKATIEERDREIAQLKETQIRDMGTSSL